MGKIRTAHKLVLAASIGWAVQVMAGLPSGGEVAAGEAAIATDGSTVTVHQASDRAIINWQDFSIAHGNLARFVQPDAASATLNRVIGGNPSSLLGSLEANGQVFLINPNGVLVGADARIDAGGFLASTLDVADADFMQGGDLLFSGDSTAAVQNLGSINALGGDIFLIARKVENTGELSAADGQIGLAAGSEVLLTTGGDERVFVRAASEPGELVNEGAIAATTAELKARGGNPYAFAIRNTGVVRATGVAERDGQIWLVAENGGTRHTGSLEAANADGTGGFIETSGDTVELPGTIRTGPGGHWLIDPIDLTIDASLVPNIESSINAGSDVTFEADNNITVAADINLDGSGVLELRADADRDGVGMVLRGSTSRIWNTGGGMVRFFYSHDNPNSYAQPPAFTWVHGSFIPYMWVHNASDLQRMNTNLNGFYALSGDIDASATAGWNGGAGFNPVGTFLDPFNGIFDGRGHAIDGLTINRSGAAGLFGAIGNMGIGRVTDVALTNVSIDGGSNTGGLAGINSGTIRHSYVTGTVKGLDDVGGLVGENSTGTISRSYATVAVNGESSTGGLVGHNDRGTIEESHATGTVTRVGLESLARLGGLVGEDNAGIITRSYATGSVNGDGGVMVGGLVGQASGGTITQSYATGDVAGMQQVGGLVGWNTGSIAQSYATGEVDGWDQFGGLVGRNLGSTISDSYWNSDSITVGVGDGTIGGNGLTTAEFQNGTLANGFDTDAWFAEEGAYPIHGWEAPASFSGMLASGRSGLELLLVSGGEILATTISGAGGAYTFSFIGLPAAGSRAMVLIDAADGTANRIVPFTGAETSGIEIADDWVWMESAAANLTSLIAEMDTTKGWLTDSGILYEVNYGGDLTIDDGIGLRLDLTANNFSFDQPLNLGVNPLTISSANDLTAPAAIQVGTFTLGGGSWVQNAATLPDFFSTDFRLDGGEFLRVTGGDGSEGMPYRIADVFGLQGIGSSTSLLGSAYQLVDDIDASATVDWNDEMGFSPVGTNPNPFTGTFDGEGHVIDGLTINRPGIYHVGLFGRTVEGEITRVGLTGGSVRGELFVGGLVGYNSSSTITHSYATITVNGVNYVGGLAGANAGTITESYAMGAVEGMHTVGGLVGYNPSGGTITQSYATGAVNGNYWVGGLVGDNRDTITNSYWDNDVIAVGVGTNPPTGATGLSTAEFQDGTLPDHFDADVWLAEEGAYPILGWATPVSFSGTLESGLSGLALSLVSAGEVLATTTSGAGGAYTFSFTGLPSAGSSALVLIAGDDGAANRIVSFTGAATSGVPVDDNWVWIDSAAANLSALIADMDATKGTLTDAGILYAINGDDLTLDPGIGLRLDLTADNFSFDRPLNLGVDPLTISSANDLTATESITVGTFTLGAGTWVQNAATLPAFSSTDFRLDGGEFIRALGGDGSESAPYQIADVYGLQGAGSSLTLLGASYQLANDIDASATVNWNNGAGFAPIGDFTDRFGGDFDGRGHLINQLTIGRPGQGDIGLFGYLEGATITGVGLTGGSVTGRGRVGGLAGYNYNSTISQSYATGDVTGNGNFVGGLVGRNEGTISGTYTTGDVMMGGDYYSGGLVGYNGGTISRSYATGKVRGNRYVGGLAGFSNGTITQSYATGAVTGDSEVGGLVGSSSGTITQSYATGAVTGDSEVGGLVGLNFTLGMFSNSYWDSDVNSVGVGDGDDAGASGLTTADFQDGTLPTGFDSSVWFAGPGAYPILRGVTPITMEGIVVSGEAGLNLSLIAGGSVLATTTTGAGGTFDFTFRDDLSADPTTGLILVDDGSANRLIPFNPAATGIEVADQWVWVESPATTLSALIADMRTTKGTLIDAGVLYDTTGGNLDLDTGIGLRLDLTADDFSFDQPLNLGVNPLTISSANGLTAPAAIEVGTFTLGGGSWVQNQATLPAFSSTDFRLEGGEFLRVLGGDGSEGAPYRIADVYGLQGAGSSSTLLGASYQLAGDIDASATVNWNGGEGFAPIGDATNPFTGRFDGEGYVISSLTIERPDASNVGLFGRTENAVLTRIGLEDVSITGDVRVGGLVGLAEGTISDSYVSGEVKGVGRVGGLVGDGPNGTISGSHATSSVDATDSFVGGLVGLSVMDITDSFATGAVSGSNDVGGLAGRSEGAVTRTYASGTVTATAGKSGGLIGGATAGSISESRASGTVNGANSAGGLVGRADVDITNSYATGAVTGTGQVGGLVGYQVVGTIAHSYARGAVVGTESVGGLLGDTRDGTITQSYWDSDVNSIGVGIGDDAGATGLTTAEFQNGTLPTGFDETVWFASSGAYPVLRGVTPLLLSGQLLSNQSGVNLSLVDAGEIIATTTSGTDGSFSFDLAGQSYGDLGTVLIFVDDGSANRLIPFGVGASDLEVAENWVWMESDAANLTSLIADMDTTKGALTDAGILYGINGGDLEIDSDIGLRLDLTADDFSFDVPLNLGADPLTISSANGLTATESITAGTFTLGAGSWVQNAADLPDFSVRDFRLQGGEFIRVTGGDGSESSPYQIADVFGLQGVGSSSTLLGASYQLANDIDASATASWNGGEGFEPIGTLDVGYQFAGTFNGEGHVIEGLTINRPTTEHVGLFGMTDGTAAITGVGMVGGSVAGDWQVGGLVGNNNGTITQSYAASAVNGGFRVGGLVGENYGTITQSYATGAVNGDYYAGGLVGRNPGTITQSYATGAVNGGFYVGGLVGEHDGTITQSYWDSDVNNIGFGGGATAGATGLTTAKFQDGTLPDGFDPDVWGAEARKYPQLRWSLPDNSLAGELLSGAAGRSLSLVSEGAVLATTTSAADGSFTFYFEESPAAGSTMLILIDSANGSANRLVPIAGVDTNGIEIADNWVWIDSAAPNLSALIADMGTTKGALTDAGILYAVNGGDLDLDTGIGLRLDLRDEDFSFDQPLNLGMNPVGIWGAGDLWANESITAGTFLLHGGTWIQVAAELPTFIVDDFRLDGGEFIRATGGEGTESDPLQIVDIYGLQGIGSSDDMLEAHFVLANGIDASGTANWNNGEGFAPIGDWTAPFSGTFDGQLRVIDGLTIDRPTGESVGLFGHTDQANISGIGLINVDVTGAVDVGALVGTHFDSFLGNSYASGKVTGAASVGGLVGMSWSGSISDSHSAVEVTGEGADSNAIGGLVGVAIDGSSVSDSSATDSVTGTEYVGGLVGMLVDTSSVSGSWASGAVTGTDHVGGLIGIFADDGNVSESAAQGAVTGRNFVGGLIGLQATSDVFASSASGTVNGEHAVGGLVGLQVASSISDSWASGAVTGTDLVGGLTGFMQDSVIGFSHASGVIHGVDGVGGLVGADSYPDDPWGLGPTMGTNLILASYATGDVTGDFDVGGMAGRLTSAAVLAGHATGDVLGDTHVGGLIGKMQESIVLGSHATGDVTGELFVGGLVGGSWGASEPFGLLADDDDEMTLEGFSLIGTSYATGDVHGYTAVGGLAGIQMDSITLETFATGSVTGTETVGGLVGAHVNSVLSDSYASGAVTGESVVGGLVGGILLEEAADPLGDGVGAVLNSYASGVVTGISQTGGLAGFNDGGSIESSYWVNDHEAVGVGDGELSGAIGVSRETLQNGKLPAGFTSDIWFTGVGSDPVLRWVTPITFAGKVSSGEAGLSLSLISDGEVLAETTSEADGSFTFTFVGLPEEATTALVSIDDGSANRLVPFISPAITGVEVLDDWLWVGSEASTFSALVAEMEATLGGLGGPDILYTVGGGELAVNNGIGLRLDLTAESFTFDQPLDLGVDPLTIWGANELLAPESLTAGTFTLTGGLWNQNALTLPEFSVADFRIEDDGTFLRVLGGDGSAAAPYQITDLYGLQGIGSTALLNEHFVLANSIDATGTASWNDGQGFRPIGNNPNPFRGRFDGQNHTIEGLSINRPTEQYVGLFGIVYTGTIENVGLIGGSVLGRQAVGGLAGMNHESTIVNSFFIGSVSGLSSVGGLVGRNYNGGVIIRSASDSRVTGDAAEGLNIGGLVGSNVGESTIADSYAAGEVSGNESVGGLVGYNSNSTVTNSYASGEVAGSLLVGGLIGESRSGIGRPRSQVTESYATGNVTGDNAVGGLVGSAEQTDLARTYASGDVNGAERIGGLVGSSSETTIAQSYASGAVTATELAGGLVGDLESGTIDQSYATGAVSDVASAGGLVGANNGGIITASYWDSDRVENGIGAGDSSGATGLSTAAFQDTHGFMMLAGAAGWDFDTVWAPPSVGYYPELYALSPVVRVHAEGRRDYGGINPDLTATLFGGPGAYLAGPSDDALTAPAVSTSADVFSNVGQYLITSAEASLESVEGVHYRVVNTGHLTIDPRALTITASDIAKIYGETVTFDGTAFTVAGLQNDETVGSVTLASDGAAATAGVGDAPYAITGSAATGGTFDSANYSITYTDGALTITPKNITVTANGGSSTYGDNPANAGFTADGLVNNENESVLTGLDNNFAIVGTTDAGEYTLSVVGELSNGNYTVTARNDGTWVVDPKSITVTANGGSSTYGDNPANPGWSADGLVNGEDASVLTGLENNFAIVNTTDAGEYVLSVDGELSNGNYTVTARNDGTWVVDPKAITVTANGGSSTYGDSPANPGWFADGLVNDEDASVLTGLENNFAIVNTTDAGEYVLSVVGDLSNGNYTVNARNDGTWIVDPKAITVTANGGSSTYGDSPANPGWFADGLVNDEDASVLTGLENNFAIVNTTDAGEYVLSVVGDLSNGNYTVNARNDGTWIVDPKAITVTANGGSSTYGDSPTNPGWSADGLVNDEDESVLAGLGNNFAIVNTTDAGDYILSVVGELTNGNYTVTARNDGTWTVDRKSLIVQADDVSRYFGEENPPFEVTFLGFVNGDTAEVVEGLTVESPAGPDAPVGIYRITPADGSAANYAIEYRDGELAVLGSFVTVDGRPHPVFLQDGMPVMSDDYAVIEWNDRHILIPLKMDGEGELRPVVEEIMMALHNLPELDIPSSDGFEIVYLSQGAGASEDQGNVILTTRFNEVN